MSSPGDRDLVTRDRELPGLGLLLDATAFLAALRESLPSVALEAARLEYLRYKPGTNVLAAYRLQVAGEPVQVYAKSVSPAHRTKAARDLLRPGAHGPLGRGLVGLADGLTVVRAFPNDAKLPALVHLDRSARHGAPGLGLGPGSLTTLRYKPERRWVCRFDPAAGGRPVVLKAHGPHRFAAAVRGADAFRDGEVLRLAPRGPRWTDLQVLGAGWLGGRLLDTALAGREAQAALALTGRALAELHAQRVTSLPVLTREAEVASLQAVGQGVSWLLPSLRLPLGRVCGDLAARLAGAPPRQQPVHGDCYAKQILVQAGTVGLLDLDQAALGDPALDLGLFLAHLERDVLRGRLDASTLPGYRAALLQGYADLAGGTPEQVPLYTATSLLRLLPDPFRHREPAWEEQTRALFDRVQVLTTALPRPAASAQV